MSKEKKYSPESLMMSYGFDPELSEGAIKPPIFLTSTWGFPNAEAGKRAFRIALGMEQLKEGEKPGLIYSRFNHPDLQIAEERLALWDKAETSVIFSSGMSAIATPLFALLNPGDTIVFSEPIYGGTDKLLTDFLRSKGYQTLGLHSVSELKSLDHITQKNISIIILETPANPTNKIYDIEKWANEAERLSVQNGRKVIVMVDNTFLGPVFQHPLEFGADLVVYSATKFIGGHSDIIAGAVSGSKELTDRVRGMRNLLGTMSDPFTTWLILRSLETLKIRMATQADNACYVAEVLKNHEIVKNVHYLGYLEPNTDQYRIYKKQCLSSGSMVSFEIKGGEKIAFKFLDSLKLFKLAVSLGSNESLAQHPAAMTHASVSHSDRQKYGITDGLIRLSVGIENNMDLVDDITSALNEALRIYKS